MSRFVNDRKLCRRGIEWSRRCRDTVRGNPPSPSPLPPGARDSWRQAGADVTIFSYDDNGNLTNKTDGLNTPTPTTTALSYDPLDQMVTASKTWEQPQNYQYDDQGRRISKSVGGKVTNYVYNGQDIIAEYTGTWNKAAASYTHGSGTDQPLIRTTGAATPISQYYHQDGLGSVTAVTDQTGTTVGTARNDAWGNKLSGNGGIPQYGYTGREPDETGFIFYRGRYYDPTIGRFIQRDPIGMEGGMNLYAYVDNNPVNFTDPMGLSAFNNANTNQATAEISPYNTGTPGLTSANPSLAAVNAGVPSPTTFSSIPGTLLADSSGIIGPSSSPQRQPDSITSPEQGTVPLRIDIGADKKMRYQVLPFGFADPLKIPLTVLQGFNTSDLALALGKTAGEHPAGFTNIPNSPFLPDKVLPNGAVQYEVDLSQLLPGYLMLKTPGLIGPPPTPSPIFNSIGNVQICTKCDFKQNYIP